MSRFIQLHLLTPYAAANLNRDDTGRPKTLNFGGAERLRVSSQSLKRAFRTSDVFAKYLPDALGARSKFFGLHLRDKLIELGVEPEKATELAVSAIGKNGDKDKRKNILATWDKKKTATHSQIVNLGKDEIERLDDAAVTLQSSGELPEKESVILFNKPRAADIAMFGRMLADNPGFNVEAAAQVAHAFTTHRATVEDDYFTAVDDFENPDDEDNTGASHIGIHEYGAGLFYLYICINAELLTENLSGDKNLAADALAALIEAAATVSPTGKQNSYASRSKANYGLLEIGDETPRSLAAAFQKPVGGEDHFAASVDELTKLKTGFARVYGESFDGHVMNAKDPASATLADLIAAARAAILQG